MKMRKALRHTLMVALVGVITTLFVIYVQYTTKKTNSRNRSVLLLANDVSNRVTKAHLWFEELLAGDVELNFENDVIHPLTTSLQILQGAYDGQPTLLGDFEKSSDEETRAILKEAIIENEKLIIAARERGLAQSNPPVVTDSAGNVVTGDQVAGILDQNFDLSYRKFQSAVDRLAAHVRAEADRDKEYANTISWVLPVLVAASFVLLGALTYSSQHNDEKLLSENAEKLHEESRRVATLSQFIEAVSGGNYDVEVEEGSGENNLTAMLVNMKNKLKQTAEEDRRRNWSTTGQAQIGEILRTTTAHPSELYDNIIRFLVKYTKSNQGGIFIFNDDNPADTHLELLGCYAFERKKYLTKRVTIGAGLVGQCFLEGERIYLTEVPNEYISITSGLGGTNPNAVLIVPLKVNEKVHGVIELASFHNYHDFEIELVEKLAESIASTISGVKVNETTRTLLERTQQQAEEMKSQEEEIRQNMEELEATQEEMRRKQTILEKELQQSQQQAEILRVQEKKLIESQDTLQAIVDNIPRAIFWKDKDLRFMGCNKIFANVAGARSHLELIGKTDFDMAWSAQADAYRRDDMEVMRKRQPKLDIEEVNINSDGEESWVLTSKVPIINQSNEVVSILGMFEDITARKRKDADIARKLLERDTALKELHQLRQMLEGKKV